MNLEAEDYTLSIDLRLQVTFKADPQGIVASCEALDVAGEGPTKEDALSALLDTVRELCERGYEMGTLASILAAPLRRH